MQLIYLQESDYSPAFNVENENIWTLPLSSICTSRTKNLKADFFFYFDTIITAALKHSCSYFQAKLKYPTASICKRPTL
jgi:hypothetical protein